MVQPALSWNPIRYVQSILENGTPTLDEWFTQARALGLGYVELYHPLVGPLTDDNLRKVRTLLDRHGLEVSMFTCAPDFTHPSPARRAAARDDIRQQLHAAVLLRAPIVRTTAGCAHPETRHADGVRWAVEGLTAAAEAGAAMGVTCAFENHYRDRQWTQNDFIFHTDVFLEVYDALEDTPVMVNFDMSNQLMTHADPLPVLEHVREKIVHVHGNDRTRGSYQHAVVGEGDLDLDGVFAGLSRIPYTGCISLEDGTLDGMEGTKRSFAALREKIGRYYS